MTGHGERLGRWFLGLGFEDLPPDVVAHTKLHILDAIGVALLVGTKPYGKVVRQAALDMGGGRRQPNPWFRRPRPGGAGGAGQRHHGGRAGFQRYP
ncbi:MAG: hypothetical protein QF830_04830 [Rhodospirillales bacterium]|nr:hypothetical protein [Rhodospirillales bacterium]MDP6883440.1 hypothetical protein [Rhodospirillales bacterium]